MCSPKIRSDRLFVEMDDGRDDVARGLALELHDIFAEVGLNYLDACGLKMGIERDLLRHHRFAFGHELRAVIVAKSKHDVACIRGGRSKMHFASALDDFALIGLEIQIEMGERMVFDGAGLGA